MDLLSLKDFLQKSSRLTLKETLNRFQTDVLTLRYWVKVLNQVYGMNYQFETQTYKINSTGGCSEGCRSCKVGSCHLTQVR